MTLFTLTFPAIDPVLVQIGPFAVRWYALAYIAGLLLGWWVVRSLARRSNPPVLTDAQTEDLLVWITLGVILGGRLGYVFFYKPAYYLQNLTEIFMVWHGGMSFHGGVVGVVTALILFAWLRKVSLIRTADLVVTAVPVGLFFGRLANFVNGELFGRIATDVPWAMVFPDGGPLPRHPSQLYEAALEGLLLFVVMMLLWGFTSFGRRPGAMSGVFLTGYGLARIVCEFFREPDVHIGFLKMGTTMGQVLSVPMVLIGLVFLTVALRRPPLDARP